MKLHDLTGAPADAADRLLELAKDVPLAGIERSCKLAPHSLSHQRLLMANSPVALAGTPLAQAHLALQMPPSDIPAFEQDLALANFVYLGFDGTHDSLSYRIYLEFPVNLAHQHDPTTGRMTPALLARGYKWNALDAQAQQVGTSEYWWEPRLTADQVLMRLTNLGAGDAQAHPLVHAAVAAARARSNALDWTWLEVSEPQSPRRSYDLNIYDAELTLNDLAEALRTTARQFDIDPAAFEAWLAQRGAETFGHVSGGIGRDGQAFVTVYHAS
jgi:tryptophan halogenase